jgi:fused signal recognition particle receptor
MGFFDKIKAKVNQVVQSAGTAMGFDKLKEGLEKTRSTFVNNLQGILGVGRKIDEDLLTEIEDILISADIGVATAEKIIKSVRERVKKEGHDSSEDIFDMLKEEIYSILIQSPSANNDAIYSIDDNNKPHTIMVVGVNGVGKTTTIGKLAFNYKNAGKQVLIGAADTFRAAANEQLEIWAKRADVPIIQQATGADPAAVAYDTLKSAIAKNNDVVIIDTAGRLHNKGNLMAELGKISRVMKKLKESAPDDVYLVLDATTGQNALMQAQEFMKVANITGIVLTKLDGTAKGGIVIAIANELKIPVRYIGVGEKIDNLQVFDPTFFVEALFGNKD